MHYCSILRLCGGWSVYPAKWMFVVFVLISCPAIAEDRKLPITCDAKNLFLRVGTTETFALSTSSTTGQVVEVSWPPVGDSRRKNSLGNTLRSPSKVYIYRCGELKVLARTEYLNENPDGELGLIEFASVEVFHRTKRLVTKTGLYACVKGVDRFQHFGRCPEDYARNLEISRSNEGGKFSFVLNRDFFDDSLQQQERVDRRIGP